MATITETCTQEQFEGIHAALDKVRSTSRTVTVDKDALRALLIDHGALWGALEDSGAAS